MANNKTAAAPQVDFSRLPRHVAIIMDGNGRWAQKRGMPRTFGHKAGVEALREIIKYSDELGVEALTIYAFSTENWKRSTEEVGALMRLLLQYFTSEIDELNEKNVRIRILGDIDGMPGGLEKQKDALHAAIRRTHENTGLQLNIALNYGGQQEIVRAAQKLAERVAAGEIGDLSASLLKRHSGIKDYGHIFPGHGGMMDRLDSVYWATVVMYVYLLLGPFPA